MSQDLPKRQRKEQQQAVHDGKKEPPGPLSDG